MGHEDFELAFDFICCSIDFVDYVRRGVNKRNHIFGAGNMIPGHSVGMVINPLLHQDVGYYNLDYLVSSDAFFIKKAFLHSDNWKSIDVTMGVFSVDGVSNNSLLRSLVENFMIQVETEKCKVCQILIFILRLIKNYRRI